MYIICLDLEGVLTPEIWEAVAAAFGIAELKLTTRDISDYDVLMKQRLKILRNNNITLKDDSMFITFLMLITKVFSTFSTIPPLTDQLYIN